MPVYDPSPFAPAPTLLQPGQDFYCFGSKKTSQPNTRMQVQSVSANATNNATVTVLILEGPIPVIGNLITIIGTASAAGAYNVKNATITNVAIDKTTGIGTITFALTTAQLATTADVGTAIVPIAEVAEALTNNSSSVACTIPSPPGQDSNTKTVTWQTSYTSAPAGITATLQGSLVDIDSQYSTLDTSTNLAGEIRNVIVDGISFLRVRITGLGGTAPAGTIKLSI